jgi:hypothetical protein
MGKQGYQDHWMEENVLVSHVAFSFYVWAIEHLVDSDCAS